MNQDDIENFGMKVLKCCACNLKIQQVGEWNVIITTKRASWKCPIYGTLDDPDFPPRAVAIVCDGCARGHAKIIFCVEFLSSALVKYHLLESLDEVKMAESKKKYYFGRKYGLSSMARNKLMLKAAKERSQN